MLSVGHLCTPPHVPPGVGVSQPVVVTGVRQRQPSVGSLAAGESEGRVGETLHTSGHHDGPVAQTELGRGQADCLEAAGTDLVDCGAGRAVLQASPQGGLAGRGLAQPGLGRSQSDWSGPSGGEV